MQNINKSNSDNTTSVANEYVVDKLVEVATLFGRRQEQGMCVSDNAVKTSKELDKYKVWYAEKANHLATANAEIERLKVKLQDVSGEDAYIIEILQSTDVPLVALTLTGKIRTVVKSLQAANNSLTAEANSYREQYNELREAVLEDLYLGEGILMPEEVLHELQCIKNDRENYEKSVDYYIEQSGYHQLKYNRLVALLNKNKECYGGSILTAHRENEAKLKAKRGK